MLSTAVVILNWNGKKFLEEFIPGILQNTREENSSIWVADNCSADDSLQFLKDTYPQVKTIALEKNFGFAEGYNQALKQIEADVFVLLNSDVDVSPGWLTPLLKTLEEDESAAATMPKVCSHSSREFFEYAGAAGGYIDKYGYPFCRGRIFNVIEKDTNQYDDAPEIFWATGACMVIRADLYFKAGGLDKDFFAHMEEIDLCWRLKNMGYHVKFTPGSKVYHVGGGTLQMGSPQKTYLNFRNNLLLLYKNLEPGKVFSTMFTRLILDGIAGIKFLFGGEFGFFIAVIKAHFSFYGMLKVFRKKRKAYVSELFTCYPQTGIYQGSIVKAFFLNKVRSFKDLNL